MKKKQLDEISKIQPVSPKKNSPNLAIKKVVSSSVASRAKKKPVIKNETTDSVTVTKRRSRKSTTDVPEVQLVSLPTNMSQRSIEKSLVLMQEAERHFGDAIYKIAYVSGLCLLLVGGVLSVFTLTFIPQQQNAQLFSITDTSNIGIAGISSTTNSVIVPKAEFQFLSPVPDNLLEPLSLTYRAAYVAHPVVKLVATDASYFIALTPEEIAAEKYRVLIPTESVPSNYYRVFVYLKPMNNENGFIKKTDEFFIGSPEQEYIFNHPESIGIDDDESTTSPRTAATTTDEVVELRDVQIPNDIPLPVLRTDTVAQATVTVATLSLSSPLGATLSKGAFISLEIEGELPFIELYARPVNSLTSRFVTLAAKRLGVWTCLFDSTNLPNGDYEFYAKTVTGEGVTIVSKSIRLTVNNIPIAKTPTTTETTEVPRPPIITMTSSTSTTEATQVQIATTTISSLPESTELIKDNAADLNTLFEHYAVAKQTGDESLIRAATEALDEKRQTIVFESFVDEDSRQSTDRVNADLSIHIRDLQSRIDTFEDIRRDRSSGATSVDTDQDGISDVDEKQLYKTDPTLVDTDNDGITDGVEVMRGYNPLDSGAQATIRFESPKESVGLVRKELLVVDEVIPLVADALDEEELVVSTAIKGRGLPNSFVTLYIFSSPTVVTVKTDDDGFFAYTFDKELEDGQHDVYVAMTDNAGEIIAHSEPFSFIKEAEAFTPVMAADTAIVSPTAVSDTASTGYNLALGVSILAFGLILLMLGISLRNRKNSPDGLIEFSDGSPVIPKTLFPGNAHSEGKL